MDVSMKRTIHALGYALGALIGLALVASLTGCQTCKPEIQYVEVLVDRPAEPAEVPDLPMPELPAVTADTPLPAVVLIVGEQWVRRLLDWGLAQQAVLDVYRQERAEWVAEHPPS